jgi:hypothetical protein
MVNVFIDPGCCLVMTFIHTNGLGNPIVYVKTYNLVYKGNGVALPFISQVQRHGASGDAGYRGKGIFMESKAL